KFLDLSYSLAMEQKLSIFQLLILFFSDRQEGTDCKELSRSIGVSVSKKHLEHLLKLGFLEKVTKIGKKGKPLRSYLYRTSQKGKEQYLSYLGEPVKAYLLKNKATELLKEYRSLIEEVNTSLRNFEGKLSLMAEVKEEQRPFERDSLINLLESTYSELVQRSQVAPMVKISDLRKHIVEKTGMTKEQFDKELIFLSEQDPYKVQLFTGTGSEEDGVKTRKGICYYVIIRKQ
ncbi:MAG: hypothetical protein QXV57_07240, partial [Thermoproteota archaeon]